MATRSRTSFQKRQKEIARAEKQRDKAAKRAQRKLAAAQGRGPEDETETDEMAADETGADETAPAIDTPHQGNE